MINYLAVLACGVAAIVLGSWWYSPAGFGKAWMKEVGITQAQMEEAKKKGMGAMWKSYVTALVSAIVTAFVLGQMIAYNGLVDIKTALVFVGFVWLGYFAAPATATVSWEGRSWKWWAITTGYNLVNLGIMAAILVSWK